MADGGSFAFYNRRRMISVTDFLGWRLDGVGVNTFVFGSRICFRSTATVFLLWTITYFFCFVVVMCLLLSTDGRIRYSKKLMLGGPRLDRWLILCRDRTCPRTLKTVSHSFDGTAVRTCVSVYQSTTVSQWLRVWTSVRVSVKIMFIVLITLIRTLGAM